MPNDSKNTDPIFLTYILQKCVFLILPKNTQIIILKI
jgi:hypothetical protein